jgi:hypothetical protein
MVMDNKQVAHLTKWVNIGGAVGLALGVALAIGLELSEGYDVDDGQEPFYFYLLMCAPALWSVGVVTGAVACSIKRAMT